jgi:hypothetical protein
MRFEKCQFGDRVSQCYHVPRCGNEVPGNRSTTFGRLVPDTGAPESILVDQVRDATDADDIVSALQASRPEGRSELLSLRGVAMLRNVARAAGIDVYPATAKHAVIAAITENF